LPPANTNVRCPSDFGQPEKLMALASLPMKKPISSAASRCHVRYNSKCYCYAIGSRGLCLWAICQEAIPPSLGSSALRLDPPRARHEGDPPGAWRPLECGGLTPLWLGRSACFGGKRKSAVKPAHSKVSGRGAPARRGCAHRGQAIAPYLQSLRFPKPHRPPLQGLKVMAFPLGVLGG